MDRAGQNGFLCMSLPEEYGGAGADKLYSVAQIEAIGRAGFTGIGFGLHSEIVAPYILHYGTEAQKRKYLPRLASGEMVGAIAMSEPAAGSDLQGIKATALKSADGSHYVLNGSKTFITNGWHATWWWWSPRPTRPPAPKAPACCWWSAACRASKKASASRSWA